MLIPDLHEFPAGHPPTPDGNCLRIAQGGSAGCGALPARTALVAVGWLGAKVPSVGETPPQCIDRLVEAHDKGFGFEDYSRGWHDCEICSRVSPVEQVSHRVRWRGRDLDLRGHGHFLVLVRARLWRRQITYMFPELLLHYIIGHRYQPPGEFMRAVQVGQFLTENDLVLVDSEPFASRHRNPDSQE